MRAPLLRSSLAPLLLLALAAGACGSDGKGDAAASTSSSTTAKATSTSAGTSTSADASIGLDGIPGAVAKRSYGDLDGDGTADTLYLGHGPGAADRLFVLVTGSGVRSQWTESNAGGAEPAILGTADADQDGHPEVFVNPGRHVYVLTVIDSKLRPYLNAQGQAYAFSTGFEDAGTGMGCTDADGDGHRDLVGLNITSRDGNEVRWSRTIVRLDGDQARNGTTDSGAYTSPKDDAAIALLSEFTCGTETFAHPLTLTDAG